MGRMGEEGRGSQPPPPGAGGKSGGGSWWRQVDFNTGVGPGPRGVCTAPSESRPRCGEQQVPGAGAAWPQAKAALSPASKRCRWLGPGPPLPCPTASWPGGLRPHDSSGAPGGCVPVLWGKTPGLGQERGRGLGLLLAALQPLGDPSSGRCPGRARGAYVGEGRSRALWLPPIQEFGTSPFGSQMRPGGSMPGAGAGSAGTVPCLGGPRGVPCLASVPLGCVAEKRPQWGGAG